jgi:hypothetical protein
VRAWSAGKSGSREYCWAIARQRLRTNNRFCLKEYILNGVNLPDSYKSFAGFKSPINPITYEDPISSPS